MTVIIELKKLEVNPLKEKSERLGITMEHIIGFSGPGPHCYSFSGERSLLQQTFDGILNEDEIYEILDLNSEED